VPDERPDKHADGSGFSSGSLQRALEIELANQLREHNAQLLVEFDKYRQLKENPNSILVTVPINPGLRFQGTACEMGGTVMVWMVRVQTRHGLGLAL
jgi:hypothetical protein